VRPLSYNLHTYIEYTDHCSDGVIIGEGERSGILMGVMFIDLVQFGPCPVSGIHMLVISSKMNNDISKPLHSVILIVDLWIHVVSFLQFRQGFENPYR
jgi:hypothetical protein